MLPSAETLCKRVRKKAKNDTDTGIKNNMQNKKIWSLNYEGIIQPIKVSGRIGDGFYRIYAISNYTRLENGLIENAINLVDIPDETTAPVRK